MKFDDNLEIEHKSVMEQLGNYAVAVNRFLPKEEDYAYKYSDMEHDFNRGAIWGMAMMLDSIQAMDANHDFDDLDDNTILGKMKHEIEENYLNEVFNDMLSTMNMTLVSLLDEEYSNKDAEEERDTDK